MTGQLAGVRNIDFCSVDSGAAAISNLADLGAEDIKPDFSKRRSQN